MSEALNMQEDCVGLQLLVSFVDNLGNPVSVAGASGVFVLLKNPSGVTATKTATIVGDGTDGQIQYALLSGDIDIPGTWQYQGKITYGGGLVFFSEVKRIKVRANL